MSDGYLLRLVARGCAIITELNRLIELIPSPFRRHSQDIATQHDLFEERQYDSIICDFSYFKNIETFEAKINSDKNLKAADEKLCDKYGELINRFYFAFESIQRYAIELNQYVADLDSDLLVGQSLDLLLADTECCQLICEAYFILGYSMLSVDNNFEGGLRERLIVSFYRYSSYKSSPVSHLDATCNLMRTTGFLSHQQQLYRSTTKHKPSHHRPKGYPETYFERLGVNESIVNLLIAKLQSRDIYNQTQLAYPHPEHRSIALSQQASILYVLLYFCPKILLNQRSRMREITDKFFYDSWVLNVHLGHFESIIEAWQPYKAAKESIEHLHDAESVHSLASRQSILLNQVSCKLSRFLTEGWLQNEQNVLEKHKQILDEIRNANYLLKWHLLQSQMNPNWQLELSKKLHFIVSELYPDKSNLCDLLQDLAQVEQGFSQTYDRLLQTRLARVEDDKTKALDLLNELIEIFTDSKTTRWAQTNCQLASALTNIRQQVRATENVLPSADLMVRIMKQLELAQETYNDGRSLQVVQLFKSTHDSFLSILRCINLSENVKLALSLVREMGYAWDLLKTNFVFELQNKIKENPLLVLKVDSTFVKLATAFESHLMRLHQAEAQADLISITQYYSTKLVTCIQLVLHVIPETILTLVEQISELNKSSELGGCCLPARLDPSKLRNHLQSARRLNVLRLSHKISYYAKSMIRMRDMNIGLIKLEASQLLDAGIKRELSKQLLSCIQQPFESQSSINSVHLDPAKAAQKLQSILVMVERNLGIHHRAFESVRDYLNVQDAHIWRHELAHLVQTHTSRAEQLINEEYNLFSLHLDESSWSEQDSLSTSRLSDSTKTKTKMTIQTRKSPECRFNFMISTLNMILMASKPKGTLYEEQTGAWYDSLHRDHVKVLDVQPFELLVASLTPLALTGLDQLCCSLLELDLGKLLFSIQHILDQPGASDSLAKLVCKHSATGYHKEASSDHAEISWAHDTKLVYLQARKDLGEPLNGRLLGHLLSVGQLQSLRLAIGQVQASKCRFEARNLFACLETFNDTLLSNSKKQLLNQQRREKLTIAAKHQFTGRDQSAYRQLANDQPIKAASDFEASCLAKLANWLDSAGLSDPLSKVYYQQCDLTMSHHHQRFQQDDDQSALVCELLLLVLVEQCSKMHYSASLCGLIGRQQQQRRRKSLSFYVTARDSSKRRDCSSNLDGQIFFYGLWTLLYHLEPSLNPYKDHQEASMATASLGRLLHRLGEYVRCTQTTESSNLLPAGTSSSYQQSASLQLPSEIASLLLAASELVRLSRQPAESLVATTCLEPRLLDSSLALHVAEKAHYD